MEDMRHLSTNISKLRKKKAPSQDSQLLESPGNGVGAKRSNKKGQKVTKRGPKDEVATLFSPLGLPPGLLADTSTSVDEYHALRQKFLLLENESSGLGIELQAVEDEIRTLEDEKLSLLDELVVLEGLVDPSNLQPQGHRLQ